METINPAGAGSGEGNKKRKWPQVFRVAAAILVVAASLIIVKDEIYWQFSDENETAEDGAKEKAEFNVAGITLRGDLETYIVPENYDENGNITKDQTASEDIVYAIETAQKDQKIKAVIMEIDSYGGSPVAGEEIAAALKSARKPTVALIRGSGVSAAYFAATGADRIFASRNSDVGGIGVTMSYVDYSLQNQKEGISYNQLSSGKFKDAGDPDKTLTAAESELLMRDVNIIHRNFIEAVAENRNLDIKKVESLADGSTMLGEMALENGLIDEIGGQPEVEKYLKGIIGRDLEICWE